VGVKFSIFVSDHSCSLCHHAEPRGPQPEHKYHEGYDFTVLRIFGTRRFPVGVVPAGFTQAVLPIWAQAVPVPDGCLPAENKIYALITVGGVPLPALIAELGPLP